MISAGSAGMSARSSGRRLATVKALAAQEREVLQAIEETPHGALLFLADPLRFLKEHGFEIDERLAAELARGLPHLPEVSPGPYEDVQAGKVAMAAWRVRIRSLAIPETDEP
jgi:hypothetical protein